jgi:DNA-binding transcriptional LysR family regulator
MSNVTNLAHAQAPTTKTVLLSAFGRGNSGKSLGLRWVGERALAEKPIVIGDCDRNNQTLTSFFGDAVERPAHPDDDSVVAWLNAAIDDMLESRVSLLLDMGGGDLVFPRYASAMKLCSFLETEGIRPVAMHFVGPAIDDLATLHEIEQSGAFCPEATIIVLNAGLIRDTRSSDLAFQALHEHPALLRAVSRGAKVVMMPKLACMHEIDKRRLYFADAQAGRVKAGQLPLGPTVRQMVALWRRAMDAAFAPVGSWLP